MTVDAVVLQSAEVVTPRPRYAMQVSDPQGGVIAQAKATQLRADLWLLEWSEASATPSLIAALEQHWLENRTEEFLYTPPGEAEVTVRYASPVRITRSRAGGRGRVQVGIEKPLTTDT